MTRVLVRCDASLSIGSGHVIRCRTLARVLLQRGAEVTFLCRRQLGDLIALLENEFRVLVLPEHPLSLCDGLDGRELYQAWTGCSQAQDAEDCLKVLSAAGVQSADWLVVDHYGLDASWQSQILSSLNSDGSCKLLVIDDLADRQHQADLLLDQNFYGLETNQRYQQFVPAHCRQLLGPHYALLGPEYAQLQPLMPMRTQLRRVLVFFGGVDPDNLTSRALEALTHSGLGHLAVDVVLGRQSPHRNGVEALVAQRPFTTLHSALPSLAGLIARADLAIGACGATTWERACLKLPSLVVTIAANQRPFAEALAQAAHLHLLGDAADVDVEQIRSALLARMNDSDEAQCDDGGDLTDGYGASRLALAMLGPGEPITLRPAVALDQALLMRWRNDQQEQPASASADWLALCNEQNVFLEGEPDPNRLLLIASLESGCPIGQIGLELQPLSREVVGHDIAVDFLLDRCVHGFGLETDLARQGLQVIEENWGVANPAGSDARIIHRTSHACFSRLRLFDQQTSSSPPFADVGSESLALPPSRITVLSDRASWLNGYLSELIHKLWQRGHAVRWIHDPERLSTGDVCLLLSCGRLLSADQLALHRHNLVVHESDLPQGQGWSPMTWQILEGASCIPITLFEATADLDAGPIYLQQQIQLKGHELVEEWRALQAQATLELCLAWLDRYQEIFALARSQVGEPTHYRRRRPTDSQLDPECSLVEQLNLLRVVDNQNYPAFFHWHGQSFQIHVFRKKSDNS